MPHPYLDIDAVRRSAAGRWETGRWPTLLAVVSNADGQPVTLHRTYLTAEGTKAPVEPVKKLMTYPSERMLTGGAIRLFPAGATLGVAEGIETALAVHQATGLPTWSAVSAGLLAQFRPPAGVREVLIWADLDRSGAGQGAAAALAERLKIAGLTGRILLPPDPVPTGVKGIDWLDVLTGQGALAVRSVLRAAA